VVRLGVRGFIDDVYDLPQTVFSGVAIVCGKPEEVADRCRL
jgi:hypothetical protein